MHLNNFIENRKLVAESLYRYSADEIIVKSTFILFPLGHRGKLLDVLAAMRGGETVGIQNAERCHKKDEIVSN